MDNYYETCLKEIKNLISESKETEALEMVEVELSMPYIPEAYRSEFESLRDQLMIKPMSQAAFFTNIDDIKEALFSNQSQKAKALLSLENMNLRPYVEDLIELLRSNHLDDVVKRTLVMISMDQELRYEAFMVLDGKPYTLKIHEIDDPFESVHYQRIYECIVDTYESHNPSLMSLCMEVLNQAIMAAYPFVDETLTVDKIIDKTNAYLNQG